MTAGVRGGIFVVAVGIAAIVVGVYWLRIGFIEGLLEGRIRRVSDDGTRHYDRNRTTSRAIGAIVGLFGIVLLLFGLYFVLVVLADFAKFIHAS